ncbi:MAG: OmpA family protein [Gammaproteobacteria bacterium]|nr:OmpA family protein [Gammaproteobacteria bacterium]NNF62360.1 OmpA family protein [Gammaproteobacteria bacterium]NNM21229.1 OmpA family protein [Gammaproteobacteria bacterium]
MNKLTFLRGTAIAAAAIVTVSACTTINPYTREEQTSKATKGALIGAAIGAVAGVISGDDSRERRKRALIGAGVGGIAGAGVGYYMDVQEARLRAELEATGVSVVRVGDNIVLNMPGNVTFDTNQSDIKANFYPVLDSVATVLNEYEKTLVEIAGHTDSTGTDQINQPLSERRAASVSGYLQSRQIMPMRMASFGLGSRHPVADNSTAEGRQLNRRVEITLVPIVEG